MRRRVLLLGLALILLASPWVVAQEIKHRDTAPLPSGRIGATQWNKAMVVTGGTDGKVFLRDSTATDGWRFGDLSVGAGGTGFTSYAVGDLLYASTTSALAKLAAVADGTVLRSAGVGVAPLYGKVRLSGATTDISGVLPVASGGTGQFSYTIGDLLYADGSTSLARLADVAAGSYLRSGGVGAAPGWSALLLPNAATTGDLLYASATNTIAVLADAATGNALLSGGVGVAPSYGKIALTTHVSGLLPVPNGGTGVATLTGLALGNGAGAFSAYAGTSCSNQFPRSLSASGVATCASVSLTADVTGILAGANGGTNNGFFEVGGPASSLKTFTFPNASATMLTTNALVTVAQGGTGVGTFTANGVLYGNTTGAVLVTAQGGASTVLTANAGAPVFSTITNAHLAAGAGINKTKLANHGTRVFNSANISITTSGVAQVLPFDSETVDTDSYHSTSSNTSRLTAPVTGHYLVTSTVRFASNSTGYREVLLRVNGSAYIATNDCPANTAGVAYCAVSTYYPLTAADYVEVWVVQTSGGALNVERNASDSPEATMTLLGT